MRKQASPAVLALWIVMGLAATAAVLHPGTMPRARVIPLAMAMPAPQAGPELPAVREMAALPDLPMMMPMMAIAGSKDCSDHNMTFGDRERTFHGEDHQTMAAPANLQIEAAKNGPLSVTGSDRKDIAITVCKAVAADSQQQADSLLSQVKIVADGGRITVTGPSGEHWGAALIVEVPRAQSLSASGVNGPVSLETLSGNVTVNTQNGPLELDGITGTLRAEAHNGPVQLKHGSGDVSISSHNGPLSIELTGAKWSGRLEASADNGPLQVALPNGFSSGVEVESGNGPFSCQLDSCGELRRSRPGERQLVKFGGDPVVVHLRADHGPVQIGSSADMDMD